MINYYVDPGSGFIFAQGASFLWAVILGVFGALFFFFRFFFGFLKKFIWLALILLAILIIGGIMIHKPVNKKKVVILGIDAMDPNITGQLMNEGKLTNFSYLKSTGSYSRLSTTIPSESVVAWTSFATGLNPAGHDIFDFIMRDPSNYSPYLTLNEVTSSAGKLKVKTRRKGRAFWDILSKNNVDSFIYFCPNTFPAEKLSGRMLSGMGVPDLYGTIGRFSFYTSRPLTEEDNDSRGKIIHVEEKGGIIDTQIYGPKKSNGETAKELTIPLKVIISDGKRVSLEFQGKRILLKEGDWSQWQRLSFRIGAFNKAHGIVKFYLKSVSPDIELYMSPVNFNPGKPVFPISYPYGYSKELAKKSGLYYTQGMPHDTWALSEKRLDEKAFLEHVDQILDETEKILHTELKEFKGGVFFFYFETLDIIQHMFWRYIDPRHPLYKKDPLYQDTIFKYYEKIDRIIGDVLKALDKDTTLIILSDHGFSSFRRAFHLNRWLLENGYLSLKEGVRESKGFFEGIDWSKTRAYALGFGGIYLNRIGREYYGIVNDSEVGSLGQEIKTKLRQIKDPENNEAVVNNVYLQDEFFQGPYKNDAPDLFVGFNAGYRASWQTALGGTPVALLEDNKKEWSGDHLIDHNLVPGVLFINKRTELQNPSIIDIAPTILGLFGVPKSKEMPGKALFKGQLFTHNLQQQ